MMAAQLQQASEAASSQSSSATTSPGAGVTTAPTAPAPAVKTSPLRNRAADSNSPYVRAQAETLVHWQLFDNEAIQHAKKENKPIFLHIGFLACHYCRLTTQESFSNPTIASIINDSFIPIVVDREERPDVDAVFWNYLQLANSSAGWPINVFLTPELKPVFGGSYWPGPGTETSSREEHAGGDDGEEYEPIGFLGVLEKLRQSWSEREAQCRTEAQETVVQLRKFAAEGTLGPRGPPRPGGADSSTATILSHEFDLDIDQLDEAYTQLKKTFDPVNGGFGVVPKFVTPAKYSFLLQLGSFPSVVQDIVGEAEMASTVQMALYTLRKLRNSALHDHLAGGFGRASHTINWTLPHFEKLIPDNGLLLSLYLDAWLYSLRTNPAQPEFLDVVYALADYLSSAPVRLPNGGFASSESADSYYRKGDRHMREGAYYVWTRREFDAVVGGGSANGQSDMDVRVAAAHWNVLQDGNVDRENDPFDEFINQNALYISKDASELARQFNIPHENVDRITGKAQKKLAAYREKERVRPQLDGKVVVAGNGIVIGALARTGAALKMSGQNATAGSKYIAAAREAAVFLLSNLWDAEEKQLYRLFVSSTRERLLALAEDYAYLVEGLIELYEATGETSWLQWADELQKQQIALFYDSPNEPSTPSHSSSGGFYRTRQGPDLATGVELLRLKDGMDTTLPATNAVAASNLFRLGSLLADTTYTQLARETIHAFEAEILQHSWLFPGLLAQVVSAQLGGPQIAVVEAVEPTTVDNLVAAYLQKPRAGLRSLVYVSGKERDSSEAWLTGRNPTLGSLPKEVGAYVLKEGVWEMATRADLEVHADRST